MVGQITFGVFGAALAAITGVGMRRRAQMAPAMEALRFFDCSEAIFHSTFLLVVVLFYLIFYLFQIRSVF